MTASIDPRHFRNVLGCSPPGVCVVTASHEGARNAMVVGSFTSISLDPPLVGFFPDKKSSSSQQIAATLHFCANILAADKNHNSTPFAATGSDPLSGHTTATHKAIF